ncbi:MAG: questin oxidase family protein [Colwellia sp.]
MGNTKFLNLLLEKSGEYHPLYGNGLATHLPMVIIALNRLNASNRKLEDIFKHSANNLECIGSLDGVTSVDHIEQYLGDSNKFKEYLKYFKNKLKAYGTQAVLKKSLPVLISGIAASAFHALIRLAYAIEAQNQSEIAVALAYWCTEFQSFELSMESTDDTLENILTRLAPLGESYKFSPGIIVDRMSEIGDLLKRKESVIQPSSINLSNIRYFALKAFYANDDFTLLHTVTGCHAFSIIMPYLENVDISLKELWKAVLIAYLSTGLNYANKEVKLSEGSLDFDPVIRSTLESNDAHVIKLVYTCLCEYQKYKEPLYYIVAQRAVLSNSS